MKKATKLASFLIAAAMTLTGCGNNTPAETHASVETTAPVQTEEQTTTSVEPEGPTENTYTPDSTNVKLIGRTLAQDGILWLAQSASGIEFTFKGTKASVDIKGDGTVSGNADDQARFAVYVNGERKLDEMVTEAEKSYDIFSSDSSEDVTVKIIKLSESANSVFGIKDLVVTSEGGISPTPEKDLKIEFIGDSITCGYGVDDENRNHHFSTTTEDATKTYAFKTAEKLDADYSFVSYSGHGIISGYTSNSKEKNTASLVPPIYEDFAKNYGSAGSYVDVTTDWDFNSFVPDYIVINLGTNDDSYVKSDNEKKEEFVTEYAEFLKTVRKDNPDAHIVCALGIMGAGLYKSIEDAAAKYTEDTGDTNVSTLLLSTQNGETGYAADWHPTEATHEIAAEETTDHIRSVIDGTYTGSGETAEAA